MTNRPSVPEIITVNSEELQSLVRDLLPSQAGFGSELQATNVITPIIDLTATAEGSTLRADLQTALAFGSQTAFNITNTTVTIVNSPGFYRIFGVSVVDAGTAGPLNAIQLTDGVSTKRIWGQEAAGTPETTALQFDFVVFLAAGESINAFTNSAGGIMIGSSRQIATGDGTLVQPSGFPL